MIELSTTDLLLSSLFILLVAWLFRRSHTGLERKMLYLSVRSTLQLLAVALVLQTLFNHANLLWVGLLSIAMVLLAGREIQLRQQRRLLGGWGYLAGTSAMFLSSMATALFALLVIIEYEPWYHPQYAIPLLGMLLGNTMNGIALGMDRLTNSVWEQQRVIEAKLAMGFNAEQAIQPLRDDAVRTGMVPILNAMAAAGVISLPGMMTGQILAGAAPIEAVKYQILILFLIAGGTGLGVMAAISLSARRFFDSRERLRVERISSKQD